MALLFDELTARTSVECHIHFACLCKHNSAYLLYFPQNKMYSVRRGFSFHNPSTHLYAVMPCYKLNRLVTIMLCSFMTLCPRQHKPSDKDFHSVTQFQFIRLAIHTQMWWLFIYVLTLILPEYFIAHAIEYWVCTSDHLVPLNKFVSVNL